MDADPHARVNARLRENGTRADVGFNYTPTEAVRRATEPALGLPEDVARYEHDDAIINPPSKPRAKSRRGAGK